MSVHPCDRFWVVGNYSYSLRFSMKTLALMARRLNAAGPLALASLLSEDAPDVRDANAHRIVSCFLEEGDVLDIAKPELTTAMFLIADMIEEAFQ